MEASQDEKFVYVPVPREHLMAVYALIGGQAAPQGLAPTCEPDKHSTVLRERVVGRGNTNMELKRYRAVCVVCGIEGSERAQKRAANDAFYKAHVLRS